MVWDRVSTLLSDDHECTPEFPPYDLRFSDGKGGQKSDEAPRDDERFSLPNRNASLMVDFTSPGFKSLATDKLEPTCHEVTHE